MNEYEVKGMAFVAKIEYLAKRKDLKTKDSLFKVLDHLKLREGYHLGLRLADSIGMGDESWFYSYKGESDPGKDSDSATFPHATLPFSLRLFNGLEVQPTTMGAWQSYLIHVSQSLLPLFWHGNYSRREYFFDRDSYNGTVIPIHAEKAIILPIEKILHPEVTLEDDKAIVSCPYWNDWEGLVLETVPVTFKKDGKISFGREKHKVLKRFNCGICF